MYYDTADVVAIRDAVRALASVVLPDAEIVWGGHPAITPVMKLVAQNLGREVQGRMYLYQSAFFNGQMPEDNAAFEQIVITPRGSSQDESLRIMRRAMLDGRQFSAGVFIGGMEGVELECQMLVERHPGAIVFPIASTGGAARIVYEKFGVEDDVLREYSNGYTYVAAFKRLLKLIG